MPNHNLTARKKILQKQIRQLQKQIAQYPEGHLACSRNGKYMKYFHIQKKRKIYIRKKDRSLVKDLAEKKYFTAVLEDLLYEQNTIDFYLKKYEKYTSKAEQILEHPIYGKLILASLKPLSTELAEWAEAPYEINQSYPNHLRFSCMSGHIVRSKSEVLIDQALFTHQIPFRYECILKANELSFYPDFTIRHPVTGQFYFWEHFGIMDSSYYSQNALQKLQYYVSCGYIPNINLITTYETKEHPLTPEIIETIIQHYFF